KIVETSGTTRQWVRLSYTMHSDDRTQSSVYRVIFSSTLNATRNQFVNPYIALDDISFTSQCAVQSGPVVLPTLPNHSTQTTPKPDSCPTISCITPNRTKICL